MDGIQMDILNVIRSVLDISPFNFCTQTIPRWEIDISCALRVYKRMQWIFIIIWFATTLNPSLNETNARQF